MIPLRIRTPRSDSERAQQFALARKGFRLMFLGAGSYAVLVISIWILVLGARVPLPGAWPAALWHGHEMVFGYTAAVVAGFLLTAAARWTSRETAVGGCLWLLAGLWLLGRISMWLAPSPLLTALCDLAFLPALAIALARPIALARNRRNYAVVALVALLAMANGVMHLDALGVLPGWGRRGLLLAVDVLVLMMLVMGGRVIPMFTRNAKQVAATSLPNLDVATAVAGAATALAHFAFGAGVVTAVWSTAVGVLALVRTRHWRARAALDDPMLWILHLGNYWIALGALLRAAALFSPRLEASATHALTAGAIGGLTLGMMSRVALGHTGRLIVASARTRAAFVGVTLAAALRVSAPCIPSAYAWLVTLSGVGWVSAFALFVREYAPMLVQPRVDGASD